MADGAADPRLAQQEPSRDRVVCLVGAERLDGMQAIAVAMTGAMDPCRRALVDHGFEHESIGDDRDVVAGEAVFAPVEGVADLIDQKVAPRWVADTASGGGESLPERCKFARDIFKFWVPGMINHDRPSRQRP
jgi:hypothetical protein